MLHGRALHQRQKKVAALVDVQAADTFPVEEVLTRVFHPQVVAPPEVRDCYSEALALMPNCYFVNDYKRAHMDVLDEVCCWLRCTAPCAAVGCCPGAPLHCQSVHPCSMGCRGCCHHILVREHRCTQSICTVIGCWSDEVLEDNVYILCRAGCRPVRVLGCLSGASSTAAQISCTSTTQRPSTPGATSCAACPTGELAASSAGVCRLLLGSC